MNYRPKSGSRSRHTFDAAISMPWLIAPQQRAAPDDRGRGAMTNARHMTRRDQTPITVTIVGEIDPVAFRDPRPKDVYRHLFNPPCGTAVEH
jgi:hypothetical protein